MSETEKTRVIITKAHLKTIRQAIKCPASLIKSPAEKEFIKETSGRLYRFGEDIYMTEKQYSWVEKIAGRVGGADTKTEAKPKAAGLENIEEEDLPDFNELGGE